jgi:hypothetical protein
MDESLKNRVAMLLAEAEQAIDPKANGLMAHTDCNHVIAKFIVTTRRVLAAYQDLERERDELFTRLNGMPQNEFYPSAGQPLA